MSDTPPRLPTRRRPAVEPLEGRLLMHGGPGFHHPGSPNLADLTTTADLNNDGKADLVSVKNVDVSIRGHRPVKFAAVTVALGHGKGLFAGGALRTLPGNVDGVAAGDFNKDGNVDVALLTQNADGTAAVDVLLGNGRGGLERTPVHTDLGTFPVQGAYAGDVDGDGAADLLSIGGDSVFYALNAGDATGTLLPAVQQDNPIGVPLVGFGDVDGDTRPDLLGVQGGTMILANKYAPNLGEFALTFLPKLGSALDLADRRLVVADVNGDTLADFVALGDGSVHVALQDPTMLQTFLPWVETAARGVNPDTALVADVTGDGRADVFQVGTNLGMVAKATLVLVGTADGTFHKLSFGHAWDHD